MSLPGGHQTKVGVKRCFCYIRRVFSCILRHVGSDLEAERLLLTKGVNRSPSGQVRLSPLLWHRKSYPRLSGSTIFMLIIRDRNDTFGLRALDGSLGFLLGALGGSLGLTSGALGCSSVSLGALLVSFWMLLRLSSPPIRWSGVFQNDLQTTFASQTTIS